MLVLVGLSNFEKCRFQGRNPVYEEIDDTQGNDQQHETAENTQDNDGYLRPVASKRNVLPHEYEQIKDPHEELEHQPPAVRDGVIDLFFFCKSTITNFKFQ